MQFTSTKNASEATGVDYFCMTTPCMVNPMVWEYRGVVTAGSSYMIQQEACDMCGKGRLSSVYLGDKNTFENCINILLNAQQSSSASLISLFNKIAADFDHSSESPSEITTISTFKFASRTAYLWIDNYITDKDTDIELSLHRHEQGVFSEYRNWWAAFIPEYLWGESTKQALMHFYSVIEKRHEEYLNYGSDQHLLLDVEPSIENLKKLNSSMYFEIGSAFTDIQIAIDCELEWILRGDISSVNLYDLHYSLAVLNQYKNGTIEAKTNFRLARSESTLTM
jgi:hypothetical protein